tara:strand:+ start:6557 stop:7015 length:459 start_codon:yes stop_codon:yes gene_type:complete
MTKSTSETPAQAHRRERKRQIRRMKDNRKINKFRSNATIGKIFPRASFVRVVREVLQDMECLNGKNEPYLLSYRAGAALQTAAESYLDGLFDDCNEILQHTGTETLNCGTIQLVQRLRGKNRALGPDATSEPGYVMVTPAPPAAQPSETVSA